MFLIDCITGEKTDKVASHRIEEYLGNTKDIKRYLKIIGMEHMIEFKEAKPTEEPDVLEYPLFWITRMSTSKSLVARRREAEGV